MVLLGFLYSLFLFYLWFSLDAHFVYSQNTFKGGFQRIVLALEQKQRNLLLKSAEKIDVLTHAENFPWLMDFNSLDVEIIFDN